MDNTIFAIAQGATGIACIMIVEALKRAGLPSRYAAVVSLLCGLVIGLVIGEDWRSGIVGGIIAGGFAAGLYSGAKKMRSS